MHILNVLIFFQHSFTSGVFRIPHALVTDQGEYECIATNIAGSERSITYIYVIQVPGPTMIVQINPSRYYGKTGDTFTLTCDAPKPIREITWLRAGGQPLPYSSSRSPDGSVLTVFDARVEDAGIYICRVTSYTGTIGTGNATVQISGGPTEYVNIFL